MLPAQTLGHLCQFQPHDRGECVDVQRAIHERLEAREKRGLKVCEKLWPDCIEQGRMCNLRRVQHGFVNLFTAQIGRHDDYAVAEVDFTAFAISHAPTVEHLIEDIQHVAVGFFDFI